MIDQIIRSQRRTLGLQITSNAKLIVRAPHRTPMEEILRVVNDKLAWIRKHQNRLRFGIKEHVNRRQYITGETFLVLGEPRLLRVLPDLSQPFTFNANEFILDESARPQASTLFEKWYRETAQVLISERTANLANKAGLKYTSLRISGANSRWGSCSRRGRLNFSWRLVMAPLWVVDYVVAHELAHLIHHNHSRQFWVKVHEFFPNIKEARKWLRINQMRMNIS